MIEEQVPPHYKRNLAALVADYMSFVVGMSFADPATVLPAFARELTSSAPLIGFVSTLQSGGWLLPQLVAANYVAHKKRKKPYIVWPALVGRPMLLMLAATAYFWGAKMPVVVLLIFYVCHAIFWMCDGLASVPWFDVLGKAIPGRRRGRYLALSQVTGGLLSIGAGAIVRRVLDPAAGLPFPRSYSLLFVSAFVFYAFSFLALLFIKEPLESTHTERPSWKRYLPMLISTLRYDRPFRLAISARLLAGLAGMAAPFFILYGSEELGLGTAVVGLSLTALVIGRIIGGLLLGFSVEKLGSRFTVLGGVGLTAFMPLSAVLLGTWGAAWLDKTALLYVYPLVFLVMGISANALMWSFTNYILDIAPPKDRTTYVGLTNTLSGLLLVAPILGGALLEVTSYIVLFIVSLALYVVAWLLAWRLPVGETARR